ncbi:MAG: hypothetical protein WC755_05385, partial [Candidatus Woesearchaeota archaeon]
MGNIKKGQASSVFFFAFMALAIVALLIFGISMVKNSLDAKSKTSSVIFEKDLQKKTAELSTKSFGAINTVNFDVSAQTEKICFIDKKKIPSLFCEENPEICAQVRSENEDNVFVLQNDGTYTSFNVENIKINEGVRCEGATDEKIVVVLENKVDSIEILSNKKARSSLLIEPNPTNRVMSITSTDYVFTLIIQAGTTVSSDEIYIYANDLNYDLSDVVSLSPIYDVGPKNVNFNKDVTVSMSFHPEFLFDIEEELVIVRFTSTGIAYEELSSKSITTENGVYLINSTIPLTSALGHRFMLAKKRDAADKIRIENMKFDAQKKGINLNGLNPVLVNRIIRILSGTGSETQNVYMQDYYDENTNSTLGDGSEFGDVLNQTIID